MDVCNGLLLKANQIWFGRSKQTLLSGKLRHARGQTAGELIRTLKFDHVWSIRKSVRGTRRRNKKKQEETKKIRLKTTKYDKRKKKEDDMAHIRRVSAPRTTCTTRG